SVPTAAGFAGRGRAWRKQSLSSRALLLVCDLQYGAALCVGRVNGCEIVQEPPLQRFAARNSATACFRGVAVAFAETFSGLYESGAPLDDDLRMDEESFAFGSYRLIPAQRILIEDGKPLRLGSHALDILITLVESAGKTIQKEQLIASAWPDTVVDEGALRVHVAALRKALGDGRRGMRYIASVPSRGYSFVAPVARERRQPVITLPDQAAVA